MTTKEIINTILADTEKEIELLKSEGYYIAAQDKQTFVRQLKEEAKKRNLI